MNCGITYKELVFFLLVKAHNLHTMKRLSQCEEMDSNPLKTLKRDLFNYRYAERAYYDTFFVRLSMKHKNCASL